MTGNSQNPEQALKKSARSVFIFFLRFLGASIVLYLIYIKAGFIYMHLVAWGAKPVLAILGRRMIMEHALKVTEEVSLNPVVFLSLVIAIPGIGWRKRLKPALVGILILTAANILTIVLVFIAYYMKNEQLWVGTEFFNLTINFFLPLMLWFILMPVKELFSPAFNSS